ncbi:DNA-directed RNA polymerase [Ascosphaera acerosa]|nr:DNA-directed RNA polymerase [Ascosphaera acerosa]
MPVTQKGLGLDAVRNSLSMFDKSAEPVAYPDHLNGDKETKNRVYAQLRQRRLESDGITAAMNRWAAEREALRTTGIPVSQRSIGALLAQWHQDIAMEIEAELTLIEAVEKKKTAISGPDHDHLNLAPYLRVIGSDKLAAVSILATLNGVARLGVEKGVKAGNLVTMIGNAIYEEFACELIRKNNDVLYGDEKAKKKFLKDLFQPKNRPFIKQRVQALVTRATAQTKPVEWTPVVEAKIGALLASFIMSCCKIPVDTVNHDSGDKKARAKAKSTTTMQPAFYRIYALERGKRIGKIVLHEKLIQKLQAEPPAPVLAKHLPMVAVPRPWEGVYSGGFLDHLSTLTRVKKGDRTQLSYIEAAADKGQLDAVFAGLTVLGKTGWKINQGVLAVMIEAWNSGEEIGCLAPAHPHIDYPVHPSAAPAGASDSTGASAHQHRGDDKAALREYNRKMRLAENQKMSYHSQRCFQNFQLEIARAYRDETFYLPHNLDFRGRAYPLVPYFNQMGPDNCRGLLLFSDGRRLGERGLRWLKIHLANLYGFDKASLSEREQFAMDHLADIVDSAEQGLHGRRWWLQAEDPFQCLAACIELANAMRLDDPTQYVSHLPVHQDGSCNGLQHYAALGGDVVGAQQVNLAPSDRPSDIYSAVAEFVKKSVADDLAGAAGDEARQLAQMLDGKIARKVVKQTVMTNVYGVTFLGAIRQVRKQLDDLYPEIKESGLAGKCATYVARKIFQALGSMFSGAHDIQFWFGDCASRITSSLSPAQIRELLAAGAEGKARGGGAAATASKAERARAERARNPEQHFRSPIIWTTPLNLPVVQPYRENKTRTVLTNMQSLSIQEPHASDTVSKRKQLQAFPPNFIHSLDATHMLMSAVKCDELGLAFSAVHDSFWTHAADVDTMNRVLRDAFVQLHSQDLIRRLADEFNTRYGDHLYLAKVKMASPIGRRILDWRAEHQLSKLQELGMEYERASLLRSRDPLDQQRGREMVTPAAMFAADKAKNERELQAVKSLGVAMIGEQEGTQAQVERASESAGDALAEAVAGADDADDTDLISALDADLAADAEAADQLEASESSAATESQAQTKKAGKKGKSARGRQPRSLKDANGRDKTTWLWLPCEFPDVPKKGEFDVASLRDSEYFFS